MYLQGIILAIILVRKNRSSVPKNGEGVRGTTQKAENTTDPDEIPIGKIKIKSRKTLYDFWTD